MTIIHNEEWIQIATLDEANQIWFTPEFQDLMNDLGWEAKAFVGHLLGLWYDPFEHMLDYSIGWAKLCYISSLPLPGKYLFYSKSTYLTR